MGQIFLIRHGQASFGAENYDALSPLGVEQAQLLGRWFADCGMTFDQVASGTMQRHQQTAQICLAALPAPRPMLTDADFNEYDHEDVLFRDSAEKLDALRTLRAPSERPQRAFRQLFEQAMQRWIGSAHDADYRETWSAFRRRTLAAIERLTAVAEVTNHCLVFTSGGTIATICCELLGAPDRKVPALAYELANSSITRLRFRGGRVMLSML